MLQAATLRPRTDDDTEALLDLWAAAWRVAMPTIDFDARRPWFRGHLAALEAAGSVTICAMLDARLVGFVVVDAVTGYLDQIVVAVDVRGCGIASLLLDDAKRRAPGRLVLDVNADNARALRFYAREGFVAIGDGINERSGLPTRRLEWRPSK